MRIVFLVGIDEEDALENSEIFYSRRDARIHATASDYNDDGKRVFEVEVFFNEDSLKEV